MLSAAGLLDPNASLAGGGHKYAEGYQRPPLKWALAGGILFSLGAFTPRILGALLRRLVGTVWLWEEGRQEDVLRVVPRALCTYHRLSD